MTDKPLWDQLVEIGASKPEAWESLDRVTIERETLLPCPFCGHVGLDFTEGSTFRWIVASCSGCGATTGETRIQTLGQGTQPEWMAEAQQDAIKQWNRRAALAAQPAEPVARVVPYGATVKLIWEDTAAAHNCKPGPLYAAPPAPAAVPMTEEVLNIHKPYYSNIEWPCFKAGVRFAEMVHGTAATTCHVPPGWKLVPIEPTEAMIASGAVALVKASHSDIDPTMEEVTAAYRAMIAAGDKP